MGVNLGVSYVKKAPALRRGFLGDPGRIQTFNLQSRNLMLYSVLHIRVARF